MTEPTEWKKTACILCECNCGVEVQLGGDDGRQFTRIRGDRDHVESRGYVCQKAGRLNYYQNSTDRILVPQRRCADGSYEEVSWDVAIREVADRLVQIRDTHGGAKIFYFGGGGQGNHLPAGYATSTRNVLGSIYRSNALAQEKTGEIWVHQQMTHASGSARGDFERCEVGMFLGKNPWQSHSIPRARVTLREMAKDPDRALIVVDVCRTETAEIADYFLQVRPGTDAWLVAAMLGILVEEERVDRDWVAEHTTGFEEVVAHLEAIDVDAALDACGVDEDLVRAVVRRIAQAESVSIFEDLGVQMNRHSTLVSYLQRLVWMLTGNFAKLGTANVSTALVPLGAGRSAGPKKTPVAGAPIIAGLTPCNLLAEEILSDHPDRYRAMIIESANPVHSLADSPKMRQAMAALDFSVAIDVAMTETARCADYVLPATTQYEKAEATFFNFGFPQNTFSLRRPVLEPAEGPLPEPEIHARLVEAMAGLPQDAVRTLREALEGGRAQFAEAFLGLTRQRPELKQVATVLLYRTLGESLPRGQESAAALWAAAHICARLYPDSLKRAGIEGDGPMLGERLFDKILASPSGLVFTDDPPEISWDRLGTADKRLQLVIPELLDELDGLASESPIFSTDEFPFLLSAGERRSFTANTINRDPAWRRNDSAGSLRMSPEDATALAVENGGRVRVTTRRGSADVLLEVSPRMQPGHISLPNGLGVDYPDGDGSREPVGLAPNELTSAEDRDWIAGTPWHKSVPARVQAAP
ncbi:MAG: molybdopterin-dependent oxidoreductase [Acidobacteriota bacterium]|nr:molybdopterin-dependent oxidoreductase [Acidobacteriota bacterium]